MYVARWQKTKTQGNKFWNLNERNNVCHEKIINGKKDEKHRIAYCSVDCVSYKGSSMFIDEDYIKHAENRPNRYNQ